MITKAAKRRYLVGAGAALAVIAVIAMVLVVVTTDDGTAPSPEFTLTSTTRPIPDGAPGGGSCTTITRTLSSDGVVVVHDHLLSSCAMRVQIDAAQWVDISRVPLLPASESSSQEEPARPQSRVPNSSGAVVTTPGQPLSQAAWGHFTQVVPVLPLEHARLYFQ